MNRKTNPVLRNAIRMALYAGIAGSVGVSVPVLAAEEDANEVEEEVIVTGSRIERNISESASPITVFSSEDIAAGGYTTVEDFVQQIPAVTGGFLGSSVNNGNRGFATAALRGLGSGRTLILVNGRRYSSGDLNAIPASFIDRVEVLRDGASAVYGADAIAGVINFITKTDFEGAEISGQYDVTSEGDGEIADISLTIGSSSERGHAVFNATYTDRQEIWQGDRDFSECPITEQDGKKICAGSGTTYPAHVYVPSEGFADYIVDNGVPRPFEASDSYNYAAVSYQTTPQTLYSLNGNARYDIADTQFTTVSTFIEGSFTNRQSEQLMAPLGTFWFPLVPESNPGNVFGEDVYITRRLVETGGRRFTQDANDYRFIAGFDGELNNGWSWDTFYNYSRFIDNRVVYGQGSGDLFQIMLDPELCAGDPNCPGVWDPFVTDSLTQEMAAFGTITHSPVIKSTTEQFAFNLVGDMGGWSLPAGEIQWAAGYEHRSEYYLSEPDGAAAMGLIYYVTGERTEGEYEVDEFYGELLVPLLADVPFAQRLDINLALRNTDYDYLSGSHTSGKYGIEWEPIDGLAIKATYADGFRGASITELYNPQERSADSYNDPCQNWGSSSNQAVRDNCAAHGIPPDFSLTSDQTDVLYGGNPDLEPEESESTTIGIAWVPEFAPDLSIAVDWFDIEITEAIGTAGTDNVITGCYESQDFSSPICALIEGPGLVGEPTGAYGPWRDPLGNVSGVLLTNANLAGFETSGIDFDIRYRFDDLVPGELELGVMGTYLSEYQYQLIPDTDWVEATGKVDADQWEGSLATFPEWRTNLSANWYFDNWTATWIARYMSETEDIHANDSNLDNIADSVWYHDVQGTYQMGENVNFALGVRNLFDEEAPYITNNQDMNTINMSYDTAGQYWYGRVIFRY